MNFDKIVLACISCLETNNAIMAAIVSQNRKRAAIAALEPPIPVKIGRKVYDRPDYKASTWWLMLAKGDCKIEGHPQNNVFRRRFSIPFTMFRQIVSDAREWIISGNKNWVIFEINKWISVTKSTGNG